MTYRRLAASWNAWVAKHEIMIAAVSASVFLAIGLAMIIVDGGRGAQ